MRRSPDVTDNRMKDRVKGLLGTPTGESGEQPAGAPGPVAANPMDTPHQALHVLTLAQRTADQHVASAQAQADKIAEDARATAEQIARDAQVHAHKVRQDADKTLADAREAAAQIARDARARAEEAQREADRILADAQAKAEQIAADAQANAEELKMQAEQRYHDVVGSLATKRESLQQQIEALEQFDRDYRSRLTSFMQGQLRALWVDEPRAGEFDGDEGDGPVPVQRNGRAAKAADDKAESAGPR
jgi:cell division septum initiation protein DivIVA